jgi:hypothetical protein
MKQILAREEEKAKNLASHKDILTDKVPNNHLLVDIDADMESEMDSQSDDE